MSVSNNNVPRVVLHGGSLVERVPLAWQPLRNALVQRGLPVLIPPGVEPSAGRREVESAVATIKPSASPAGIEFLLEEDLRASDVVMALHRGSSYFGLSPAPSRLALPLLGEDEPLPEADILLSDRAPEGINWLRSASNSPTLHPGRLVHVPPVLDAAILALPHFNKKGRVVALLGDECPELFRIAISALLNSLEGSLERRCVESRDFGSQRELLEYVGAAQTCILAGASPNLVHLVALAGAALATRVVMWNDAPRASLLSFTLAGLNAPLHLPKDAAPRQQSLRALLTQTIGALREPFDEKIAWIDPALSADFIRSASASVGAERLLARLQGRSPEISPLPPLQRALEWQTGQLWVQLVTDEASIPTNPLGARGADFSEQYLSPFARARTKSFLHFWNELPARDPEKQRFQNAYLDTLREFVPVVLFREPGPAQNRDFIECAATLESFLETATTTPSRSGTAPAEASPPHAFNKHLKLALSDIALGYVCSIACIIADPETAPSVEEPCRWTDTLLDWELAHFGEPPASHAIRIFTATARRRYDLLLGLAKRAHTALGPRAGMYTHAGAMLLFHGHANLARQAFEAEAAHDAVLEPASLAALALFSFLSDAACTGELCGALRTRPGSVQAVASSADSMPLLAAAAARMGRTDLVSTFWSHALSKSAGLASMRFFSDRAAANTTPEDPALLAFLAEIAAHL